MCSSYILLSTWKVEFLLITITTHFLLGAILIYFLSAILGFVNAFPAADNCLEEQSNIKDENTSKSKAINLLNMTTINSVWFE